MFQRFRGSVCIRGRWRATHCSVHQRWFCGIWASRGSQRAANCSPIPHRRRSRLVHCTNIRGRAANSSAPARSANQLLVGLWEETVAQVFARGDCPSGPRACVRSRSLPIARIATRRQLFTDYTLVFGLYEVAVNYAQSSIINSSIRSKCLRLDVTSVASTASAWAAIAISKSSTLAPRVSSFAFTRPKWSETSGVHIAI